MKDVLLWGVALFIVISLWPVNHGSSQHATTTSSSSPVATATPLVLGAERANTELTTVDTGYVRKKQHRPAPRRITKDDDVFPDDTEYFAYVRPRDFGSSDTYSYYVTGHSAEGRVTGTIDTRGTYGEGYLKFRNGERVWINTVWTSDTTLDAHDDDGTYYELEIE